MERELNKIYEANEQFKQVTVAEFVNLMAGLEERVYATLLPD